MGTEATFAKAGSDTGVWVPSMSSDDSALSRVLSAPSWVVVLLLLGAILAIDLGPETYAGIDGDLLQWAVLGVFVVYEVASMSVSSGTSVETDPETPVAVGEHYRPATDTHGGGDYRDGVYRVVGAGERVTLLRVGDANGRRVHSGEVTHLDQSTIETDFEAATGPDAGFSPVAGVRNALSGIYWTLAKYR